MAPCWMMSRRRQLRFYLQRAASRQRAGRGDVCGRRRFHRHGFGATAQTGAIMGDRTSLFYYTGTVNAGNIALTALMQLRIGHVRVGACRCGQNEGWSPAAGAPGDANGNHHHHDRRQLLHRHAIGWNTTDAIASTIVTLSPDANNTTLSENFSYQINLNTGGVLGGGFGTAGGQPWPHRVDIGQTGGGGWETRFERSGLRLHPLPEPSTALLGGLGLLALLRRKRA